jgi:hypothetical protein
MVRTTLVALAAAVTLGIAALAPTPASAYHAGWHGYRLGYHGFYPRSYGFAYRPVVRYGCYTVVTRRGNLRTVCPY